MPCLNEPIYVTGTTPLGQTFLFMQGEDQSQVAASMQKLLAAVHLKIGELDTQLPSAPPDRQLIMITSLVAVIMGAFNKHTHKIRGTQ